MKHIIAYQVQEQKLEPVCEHGVLESNLCSDCYEDAELEDIEQSNTVAELSIKAVTNEFDEGFQALNKKCDELQQQNAELMASNEKLEHENKTITAYTNLINRELAVYGCSHPYGSPKQTLAEHDAGVVEEVACFIDSQKGGPFEPSILAKAIRANLEYGDAFSCADQLRNQSKG